MHRHLIPNIAMRALPAFVVMVLSLCLMVSCGGDKSSHASSASDVLLSVGDSTLTLTDVITRIPVGLSESDSALMFNQIVDSWIENMLLTEMAVENIDNLSEIERKVQRYRNQLIIGEYLSKVRRSERRDVPEDAIRRYYEENADDLRLEVPLVKGVYLKVPSNIERISDLRRWIFNPIGDNIDRLESYGLSQALQYDYFGERWVDWNSVAEQIPYRFYDPDAFLESTRNFETSYNGSTYFLHVSEYLPSGSPTPYEFAAPGIANTLREKSMAKYEKQMMLDLCSRALEEGRLRAVGYDPIERKVTLDVSKVKKEIKQ